MKISQKCDTNKTAPKRFCDMTIISFLYREASIISDLDLPCFILYIYITAQEWRFLVSKSVGILLNISPVGCNGTQSR